MIVIFLRFAIQRKRERKREREREREREGERERERENERERERERASRETITECIIFTLSLVINYNCFFIGQHQWSSCFKVDLCR